MLVDVYQKAVRSDDYPYGISDEEWLAGIRSHREHWGDREYLDSAGGPASEDRRVLDARADALDLEFARW